MTVSAVQLEILDPEEIREQAVEQCADQDHGPERCGQTGRDGLEAKPALLEHGIERPQHFGVDDFFALAGGLEIHDVVFQAVEDHVAVFEGDTLLVSGPFFLDDSSGVFAHERFEIVSKGLRVAIEVTIQTGERGCLGGDNGVDLGVILPGCDGDQTQSEAIEHSE